MNQSQVIAQLQRIVDLAIDWPCPRNGLLSIVLTPRIGVVTIILSGRRGSQQMTFDAMSRLDREEMHARIDDMAELVGIDACNGKGPGQSDPDLDPRRN